MHLILSDNGDISTNEVCEWLYMNNCSFQRINLDTIPDETTESEYSPGDFTNFQREVNFKISDVEKTNVKSRQGPFLDAYDSIWFRRPDLNISNIKVWENENYSKSEILKAALLSNKSNELKRLYDFFLEKLTLTAKKVIGDPEKSNLNKLRVLSLAQSCDMKIPNSYIVSDKAYLRQLSKQYAEGLIVKSIYEMIKVSDDTLDKIFIGYTTLLTDELLRKIPDQFSPSLVQENIPKEFEIRVFFLEGKYYSMAIFSQNNSKTKVDFRNYDDEFPNRMIPFTLPNEVTSKCDILMKKLNLNTGSLDMIYSKNNEFVFLEVNPIGQFGMVSKPCLYNIEFMIYKYLSEETN